MHPSKERIQCAKCEEAPNYVSQGIFYCNYHMKKEELRNMKKQMEKEGRNDSKRDA